MGEARQKPAASPACARAFKCMVWGLPFFLVIPVRLRSVQVDIIPDFIGWVLIVHGLGIMAGVHPLVRSTRKLAVIAGALSVFGFLTISVPVQWGNLTSFSPVAPLLLVASVLEIAVAWQLGAMVMDMATEAGKTATVGEADFRRKFYGLSVVLTWAAYIGSAFVAPGLTIIAAVVIYLLRVGAICLMMELLSRAGRMCAPTTPEKPSTVQPNEGPKHPADNQ